MSRQSSVVDIFRPFRSAAAYAALAVFVSSASVRAEGDMTFEAAGGPSNAVSATGHITEQTPKAFAAFLRQSGHGTAPTVYLDSPGGTVLASMEFGTLLRKAGATVVVGKAMAGLFGGPDVERGECYSACVYALMGGRRRVIPAGSEVGIHRMFLAIEGQGDVTRFASSQQRSMTTGIRGELMRYTSRMGVSPELITRAEQTQSGDFHILSPAEIQRWRLGVPN